MNKKVNIQESLKKPGFIGFSQSRKDRGRGCIKSSVNMKRKKVYKIEQKHLTFSKKSINITL